MRPARRRLPERRRARRRMEIGAGEREIGCPLPTAAGVVRVRGFEGRSRGREPARGGFSPLAGAFGTSGRTGESRRGSRGRPARGRGRAGFPPAARCRPPERRRARRRVEIRAGERAIGRLLRTAAGVARARGAEGRSRGRGPARGGFSPFVRAFGTSRGVGRSLPGPRLRSPTGRPGRAVPGPAAGDAPEGPTGGGFGAGHRAFPPPRLAGARAVPAGGVRRRS